MADVTDLIDVVKLKGGIALSIKVTPVWQLVVFAYEDLQWVSQEPAVDMSSDSRVVLHRAIAPKRAAPRGISGTRAATLQ